MAARVVFIYGPAAAGKFTIGSRVADALEIPLFHNHLTVDLALSLFEFGSEGFKAVRAAIWRTAFREAARSGTAFVFTFHPEATVETGLVQELIETIEGEKGSVFLVELLCARETVLERLDAPSRKAFGKLTDASLYQTIEAAGGFDYAGLPEPALQIDTTVMQPEAAAAVIVDALRARDGASEDAE